ncbi:MAG: hypothetical protein WCO93_12470, partial [bacterium]
RERYNRFISELVISVRVKIGYLTREVGKGYREVRSQKSEVRTGIPLTSNFVFTDLTSGF